MRQIITFTFVEYSPYGEKYQKKCDKQKIRYAKHIYHDNIKIHLLYFNAIKKKFFYVRQKRSHYQMST